MFNIKTSLNISVHTVAIFLSFLFTSTCLHVSPLLRYNITHSSNCHFSMLSTNFFFKVISNSIFYNYINSIHKLINDSHNEQIPSFFFFFSFHAFFSWLRWLQSFFFSFSTRLLFLFFLPFFFFSWSWAVFLFFFLFFFCLGHRIFSCFRCWAFFLVSFFWGPCVFSLSFHRLNKLLEIDPMFLAVSLIVWTPSRNHAMNDMPSSGTKYVYVPYPC